MNVPLRTKNPSRITLAIEENLFGLIFDRKSWSKGEVHEDPEMIWCRSDIPYLPFNMILRSNMSSRNVDEAIENALSRYRDHDVPVLWWIGPETQPRDLGQHLSDFGLKRIGEMPGMAIDLSQVDEDVPYPLGLRIRVVEDFSTMEDWARIWREAFIASQEYATAFDDLVRFLVFDSSSECICYIGSSKDEPVAISMVHYGSGVAGIYNVGTIPGLRGKGIGTAMTVFSLLEAKSRRYQISTLHSSDLGLGVYKWIGSNSAKSSISFGKARRIIQRANQSLERTGDAACFNGKVV